MKKEYLLILLLFPVIGRPILKAQRINDLAGINACIDQPIALQKRFSWVRVPHDTFAGKGQNVDFEKYFRALSGRGIPIFNGGPLPPKTHRPYNGQQDPATYQEHALWLSLFAAKYGGQPLYTQNFMQPYSEDAPLILNNNGLVQFIEDNNEPNKSWYDTQATPQDFLEGNTLWYFSPLQFAAMLRADFDGDGSNLTAGGQPLGMANASAGAGFAMGGLSGLHGQYIEDMDDPLAAGNMVANFHHYCTDQTATQTGETDFMDGEYTNYSTILLGNTPFDPMNPTIEESHGVSPEEDNLREKLSWLKEGIGGDYAEYWLSEFGYDSHPAGFGPNHSGVDAPALGSFDSQKTQAQWLVRGVLEAAWSKSIDKLMFFELADDPSIGDNHYRFSGLLTDRFVAKRAWFYIMTLKNILGEYHFDKEIFDGFRLDNDEPTTEFSVITSGGQSIRVYEFQNGTEKILAIWSPTSEAIAPFSCEIDFPPNTDYPYVLDGRATLYTIQELNEKGKKTDWSEYVDEANNRITDIPVSETPVFLRLNRAESHNPVHHVTNLSCSPSCCGSVLLEWDWATNIAAYGNKLVFYREHPNPGQACPAFNFTECTLYANYTGNDDKITVNGLREGAAYCFYVIPVALSGVVPDDLGQALSCSSTVSGCTGCLLNITAAQVSYDPEWTIGVPGTINPVLIAQVERLLGITDGLPNTCDQINGPPCNLNATPDDEGWAVWQLPAPPALPEPNTFFINFDTPKRINTIYYQDWTGNGEIEIEYYDCFCERWRPFKTLELKGFPPPCNEVAQGNPQGTPTVVALSNFTPNRGVMALKITKLHSDAVIRRLYFCGSETVCTPMSDPLQGSPENFMADEIRKNSALLRWEAARIYANDPLTVFEEKYDLFLSEQLDGKGELVSPLHFEVEADPISPTVDFRLSGLAPGTTYFAYLKKKIQDEPCVVPQDSTPPQPDDTRRTSFTTESDGVGNRSDHSAIGLQTQTATPYSVVLSPNPAGNEVNVKLTAGELAEVLVMDNHGRLVKKVDGGGGSPSTTVSLEELPSGTYWLRTVRTDRVPLTVLLVKQ